MSAAIKKRYLDMLKQLILLYTNDYRVKVWLFGSHAKGNSRRYSDIDIAILPGESLPGSFISDLKEKIEQSTIPYSVDLVDLSQVNEEFRQKVLKEGIIWKD